MTFGRLRLKLVLATAFYGVVFDALIFILHFTVAFTCSVGSKF